MDSRTIERILADESATIALAGEVARLARAPGVIALAGALGTGKSVFARGFVQALCGDEEVPSPTFTLVQAYEAPHFTIYHFDLYRLEDSEEAYALGIEDAFADGLSMIEWPDRLGALLPQERLDVTLSQGPSEGARRVVLTGHGRWVEYFEEAGFA